MPLSRFEIRTLTPPQIPNNEGAFLRDVLESAEDEKLHVLTHRSCWVPKPMSPRARIARCIEGRAPKTAMRYDRFLAEMGRENVR